MFRREIPLIFFGIAALLLFGIFAPQLYAQGMIQVKGSDSEVNLVQRLAEVFMQKNPGVNISVTGVCAASTG